MMICWEASELRFGISPPRDRALTFYLHCCNLDCPSTWLEFDVSKSLLGSAVVFLTYIECGTFPLRTPLLLTALYHAATVAY